MILISLAYSNVREICRAEKKLCHFWDHHIERFPKKNIYKLMQWIFFSGFTDKGFDQKGVEIWV